MGQAFAKPVFPRDAEAVAQRVVHARVVGAHAFFEVYEPLLVKNVGVSDYLVPDRFTQGTPAH